ncbi:hypothetical protein ACHAQA_002149 [Verticillium albo-atrum]
MARKSNVGDNSNSSPLPSPEDMAVDEADAQGLPAQETHRQHAYASGIPTRGPPAQHSAQQEANRQLEGLRQKRGLGSKQNAFTAKSLGKALDILSSQLNAKTTHFILELIQNADDNAYPAGVQPTFTLTLSKMGPNFTLRTDCNETGFTLKNIDAICSIGESTKTIIVNGQKGFIGEKGIGFKSVFKVANQVDILSNSYEFRIDRTAHLGMLDPKPHRFPDRQRRDGHTQMLLHLLQDRDHRISDITKGLQQIKPELLLFLRQLRNLDIITPSGRCLYQSKRRSHDPRYGGEMVSLSESRFSNPSDEPVTTQKLYVIVRHDVQRLPLEDRREGVHTTEITLAFPIDSILEAQDAFAFLPIDQSGFAFIIQADFLLVANRQALQQDLPWNNRLCEEIPNAFLVAIRRFNQINSATGSALRYTWPLFLEYSGSKKSAWAMVHQEIKRRLCAENILEARDGSFRAISPVACAAGAQQTAVHRTLIAIPQEYRFNDNFIIDATPSHGQHLAFGYDDVLEELESLGIKQMTAVGLRNEVAEWIEHAGCAGLNSKTDEWHGKLASALLWKDRSKHKDKLQKLTLVPLADGSWVSCADVNVYFADVSAFKNIPCDLGIRTVKLDAAANPQRRELYTYLGVETLDAKAVCALILEKHSLNPRPKRKIDNWKRDLLFLFEHREQCLTMNEKPRWFLGAGNKSVSDHIYMQDACPLVSLLVADPRWRIQTLSDDLMNAFLSGARVSRTFDPPAALGQLQRVAQRPASSASQRSIIKLYKQLNTNASRYQTEIRDAFQNQALILIEHPTPRWVYPNDCIWRKPACIEAGVSLPQAYEDCTDLFQRNLKIRDVTIGDIVSEAEVLVETERGISKAKQLARHLLTLFQSGGITELESEHRQGLERAKLFPIKTVTINVDEASSALVLRSLQDNNWYVADKPELERVFFGRVELLDVELQFRKSLVSTLGLHARLLSRAVQEEVTWDKRGLAPDHDMTASFRSRAASFCR